MAITITTTSSEGRAFMTDRTNAIFPPFVDNTPYSAWSNGTSRTTSKKDFFQLKATGAINPVWSLVSGSLPTGLSLAADGKISGKPTREGTFTFSVKCQSGAEQATKELKVTAHPFRSKWHKEARFGFYIGTGAGAYPALPPTVAGIAAHEARFNQNFNEQVMIAQMKALNAKYLTFNAMAGDSVRMWPSTTVTNTQTPTHSRNFKTQTNYIKKLGDEAHANGMHFMAYFAADSISRDPVWQSTDPNEKLEWEPTFSTYSLNPANFLDAEMTRGRKIAGKSGYNSDPVYKGAWGTRNVSLARELCEMSGSPVDAIFWDVAATNPALYPPGAAEGDFARWDELSAAIRYYNPWVCIFINHGYGTSTAGYETPSNFYGNLYQYPDVDGSIFEGKRFEALARTLSSPIEVAADKKMSLETTNLLDIDWVVTGPDFVPGAKMKKAADIKESMLKCWAVDGTYSLAFPIPVDGNFLYDAYVNTLNEIGAFVGAHNKLSEAPVMEIADNVVTITSPGKGRIFYSLNHDRSMNMVYNAPLILTEDTIVHSVCEDVGKGRSIREQVFYKAPTNKVIVGMPKVIQSTTGDVFIKEASNYYRGMMFTVGSKDLEVFQIGRRQGQNTSPKRIVIKQFANNRVACFDWFKTNAQVEADGFQYSDIAPVLLKAGVRYYIAIQEGSVDDYASNNFSSIPRSNGIKIIGPKILTNLSDVGPITNNSIGQFINMKFVARDVEDLARGKEIKFKHPTTFAALNHNAFQYYAINATDEDETTYAQPASADYKSMFELNLEIPRLISRVEMEFFNNPVRIVELHVGMEENKLNLVTAARNNSLSKLVFSFDPILAKYVYLVMLPAEVDLFPSAMTQSVSIY